MTPEQRERATRVRQELVDMQRRLRPLIYLYVALVFFFGVLTGLVLAGLLGSIVSP